MLDLSLGGWVEDGETGVDVPLGRVDTEGDIDFDDFDAGDVARSLPGVGGGLVPCCSHTADQLRLRLGGGCSPQESSMGHSLRVGSDHVVLFVAQVDVAGLETPEDILDHGHAVFRSSMMYDDLPCQLNGR